MKTFIFDVVLNGRFVCTLKYKLIKLKINENNFIQGKETE